MGLSIVKVEQKQGGGPILHRLSDGRWILEDRGGNGNHGRWSLWRPSEVKPQHGHLVHKGASLGKLLKWAEKHPV